MAFNNCTYCGSARLIADRALAGKIICAECGRPYVKNRSLFIRSRKKGKGLKSSLALISLLIIVLIVIINN